MGESYKRRCRVDVDGRLYYPFCVASLYLGIRKKMIGTEALANWLECVLVDAIAGNPQPTAIEPQDVPILKKALNQVKVVAAEFREG